MSSAANPKLAIEYFNTQGRAEPARAALWIGKIAFEDIRLVGEDFAKNKSAGKYPHGQVPVLHVNGQIVPQSQAIWRYTAKLANLYPTDAVEALWVDSIVDSVNEVADKINHTQSEKDKQKYTMARKTIADHDLPALYKYLQEKTENSKSGYVVGNKLTIADVVIYYTVKDWIGGGQVENIPTDLVKKYTKLGQYLDNLDNNDHIKTWKTKSTANKKAGDEKEKSAKVSGTA